MKNNWIRRIAGLLAGLALLTSSAFAVETPDTEAAEAQAIQSITEQGWKKVVENACALASKACAWVDQISLPSTTKGQFQSGGVTMGYLLYTPKNAQGQLPLMVYLHGGHGKGSDLSLLTDTDGFPQYLAEGKLGQVPAYVLIPQLPGDQKQWADVDSQLMQLIDQVCAERSIDRSRICLTGHSMGGTGTWDLALAHPDVFRRIAPMSGSVKTTQQTLQALSQTEIWAFVGAADRVVKPESTEKFIQAIQPQNGSARVTVFPNTDHVGVPQCAWLEYGTELLNWLFS